MVQHLQLHWRILLESNALQDTQISCFRSANAAVAARQGVPEPPQC